MLKFFHRKYAQRKWVTIGCDSFIDGVRTVLEWRLCPIEERGDVGRLVADCSVRDSLCPNVSLPLPHRKHMSGYATFNCHESATGAEHR